MNKILNYIHHPAKIVVYLASKHFLDWIPDRIHIELLFLVQMGHGLNLDNPVTFNEKIQWLKLYNRNPEYTCMVDKYAAKSFAENTLGSKFIIPTLGVWSKFEDIDFDRLPNQFILKTTHSSGGVVLCRDKRTLNKSEASSKVSRVLKKNYFKWGREWPYKDVPRKIIAEQLISDDDNSGGSLKYSISRNKKDSVVISDYSNPAIPKVVSVADSVGISMDEISLLSRCIERFENPSVIRIDIYIEKSSYTVCIESLTTLNLRDFELELNELFSQEKQVAVERAQRLDLELRAPVDYKFFCFDGKADSVMVCVDRESGNPKFYFFNKSWQLQHYNVRSTRVSEDFQLPKPDNMNQMFKVAEKLSKGIPFVRVDLFSNGQSIKFGEMTFFPDSGHDTNILPQADIVLGNMIDLSLIEKEN